MKLGDKLPIDPEEEEQLAGFLQEYGFEMVATCEPDTLPGDKDVILLHTSKEQLFKGLRRWAYRNDAVILYDPEGDYQGLDFLAVIIDSELVGSIPIPPTPAERFINSGLSYELIERTLMDLQADGT
jgi:hypothetical protein